MQVKKQIQQLILVALVTTWMAACAPAATIDSTSAAVTQEETAVREGGNPASEEATPTAIMVADTKINLNDMTQDELLNRIPNFSSRMVSEFFEYQPYVSIQQFRREIGKYVDEVQVAEYEQYVYVPVDVNESDAETLKQLPGVDNAVAESLLLARPFASNEAFLQVLSDLVSAEDAAAATGYLVE